MQQSVASGIRHPFRQLSQSEGQITHVLLTRSPLEYPPKGAFPLDLHVLSTPPAFVLSQDQTLHRKPKTIRQKTIQAKKRSTSKQSPRIIVRQLKKTTNHHNTPKGTAADGGFIQTNSSTNTLLSSQKSDAHLRASIGGDSGATLENLPVRARERQIGSGSLGLLRGSGRAGPVEQRKTTIPKTSAAPKPGRHSCAARSPARYWRKAGTAAV